MTASNATQEQVTTVGLLEIKLGACLTAPTKVMHADLLEVALESNRVRNGMVRAWQRWREDNEWMPEAVLDKHGNPKLFNGRIVYKKDILPRTESTLLYWVGRDISPKLSTKIVVACGNEVIKYLTTKVPRQYKGKASRVWEQILLHEANAASFRENALVIPASKANTIFTYDGYATTAKHEVSKKQMELLRVVQKSAVLRFLLFSEEHGQKRKHHVCRLEVRQLTPGNKEVLRKIASGQWELSDSKIVWKEGKGHWSFQLTYKQPVRSLGLDQSRVAVLTCHDKLDADPFTLAVHGQEGFRPWILGRPRPLVQQLERLDHRRRLLRSEYRVAGTGAKGHGSERFYRALKRPTRMTRNLMSLFVENVVADVLKFCQRFNCGTVVYNEPSMGWRQKSWFAGKLLTFNWTMLSQKIEHMCKVHGLVLSSAKNLKKSG